MTTTKSQGTVIEDRFVVRRVAAVGGMGTVYRAFDKLTGDDVALKILSRVGDDSWRFARETRIALQIRHPFIVGYVAHGQTDDGAPYLALDWLDGEDLATRLLRGPLSLRESLQIVRRTARALCPIHDAGIIHRDLKPANLFLRDERADRSMLLDFGVARDVASSRLDDERTVTGVFVGTPLYMAPEQLTQGATLDARTDVYALGAVLFECLTGAAPFASKNFSAVLISILKAPVPHLSEHWREAPEDVDALCAALLAKSPADRLSDARTVYERVESILDRVDAAAPKRRSVRPKLQLVMTDRLEVAAAAADRRATTTRIGVQPGTLS
jgi:serine/threonine protein kinase